MIIGDSGSLHLDDNGLPAGCGCKRCVCGQARQDIDPGFSWGVTIRGPFSFSTQAEIEAAGQIPEWVYESIDPEIESTFAVPWIASRFDFRSRLQLIFWRGVFFDVGGVIRRTEHAEPDDLEGRFGLSIAFFTACGTRRRQDLGGFVNRAWGRFNSVIVTPVIEVDGRVREVGNAGIYEALDPESAFAGRIDLGEIKPNAFSDPRFESGSRPSTQGGSEASPVLRGGTVEIHAI